MIVIPSYRGPIYASSVGGGAPTLRSTVYVFNIFWDNETTVNRYDTTSTTTETTARGWFFK